ncbi:hypothetical protein [Nocardia nova]|uniref:hypothetical protein n=1 Tax=Nocardia nova TaxID=37330 RepID=UPI002739C72F|nr:hypothetical protein [Nocardia nova]
MKNIKRALAFRGLVEGTWDDEWGMLSMRIACHGFNGGPRIMEFEGLSSIALDEVRGTVIRAGRALSFKLGDLE